MSASEKLDVIDLIINVLKDHEASLDNLVKRLETLNRELTKGISQGIQQKDSAPKTLDPRKAELEKLIKRYQHTLSTLLQHCETINDIACIEIIADDTLSRQAQVRPKASSNQIHDRLSRTSM